MCYTYNLMCMCICDCAYILLLHVATSIEIWYVYIYIYGCTTCIATNRLMSQCCQQSSANVAVHPICFVVAALMHCQANNAWKCVGLLHNLLVRRFIFNNSSATPPGEKAPDEDVHVRPGKHKCIHNLYTYIQTYHLQGLLMRRCLLMHGGHE